MIVPCNVCKQMVLIEALQDPGGICRDCYAEAQIRTAALGKRSWTPTSSHRWREWVIPGAEAKTEKENEQK